MTREEALAQKGLVFATVSWALTPSRSNLNLDSLGITIFQEGVYLMSRYIYAKVYSNTSGVYLAITDQHETEALVSSLRVFFPALEVEILNQLPSGDAFHLRIHKLQNKDDEAAWWLIKQFCESGWEPLGPLCVVEGSMSRDSGSVSTTFQYQFRRCL